MSSSAPSILVFNVGSSTVKFGVFPFSPADGRLLRGVVETSGPGRTSLSIIDASGRTDSAELKGANRTTVHEVLQILEDRHLLASVRAVGHRLVHGGSTLKQPVLVDARVRSLLQDLIPLAPEHLPSELRAIDDVARLHPSLPQIACFDTAFHADLPPVARAFGLPRGLGESGVLRYGFHGLSYEYVTTMLHERGELPTRTIVAHLGNGASIAAILDGKSIDTSMGMTPAGGLVMSTRSGDLDPGVILYLARTRGFSIAELDYAVNRRGGMLGISGSSGDMRKLLASSHRDAAAREAVDVFCYQAGKCIGAYAAALGGMDLLVFTGGIGEHSPEVRARICEKLGFLGVTLDSALNNANEPVISAAGSRVRVRSFKTDEEAMIARHVRDLAAETRHL